jgi:hypothetical protein
MAGAEYARLYSWGNDPNRKVSEKNALDIPIDPRDEALLTRDSTRVITNWLARASRPISPRPSSSLS